MSDVTLLSFEGGGECPVQYYLTHQGHQYYVRYRWGRLSIDVDDRQVREQILGDELDGAWTDEETTVYLGLISDAIRSGRLDTLKVPVISDAPGHPYHRKGPLPRHAAGLLCGLPGASGPGTAGNRHQRKRRKQSGVHDHRDQCFAYIPADRVSDWIREHPAEHAQFRTEYSVWWGSYERLQGSYRTKDPQPPKPREG